MNEEVVYFELNNWAPGRNYPDDLPFTRWLDDDDAQAFQNKDWVIKNELCVVVSLIDMSFNYCITATRKWVEANCPELLTKYTKFLRYPDESSGKVYGIWSNEFLPYSEDNIGPHYYYIKDKEWVCDNDSEDWESNYKE